VQIQPTEDKINMFTKFTISGHHLEVTPALDAHAREKFGKIEEMFNMITNIHISLELETFLQVAKAEVRLAGDPNSIFAEASTEDMYQSIDELSHKVLTQVKKYHDKIKDHRNHRDDADN
jgi:putative sigma-54 modulation protein